MNKTDSFPRINRLDYLFVLRPMLFFPGWATMLAGYFIADKEILYTLYMSPDQIDYLLLLPLIIGFALLMGTAFILNQLADVESDQRNEKLYIISNGHISRTNAVREVYILAIIAFLTGLTINWRVTILFIMFFVVTGYLYNFRPFKYKDRPWASLFANMTMGWLAFAIGWAAHLNFSWQLVLDSIPYLLFNTALYLYTTFPDIEGDRLAGKRTLAVHYGHEKLMLVAFMCFCTGIISLFWLQDMQALVFYALSIPLFAKGILMLDIPVAVKTTKFGILFFSLSICLKWPFFFLMMLSGFLLTKWYYKKRFYITYPNFSGS